MSMILFVAGAAMAGASPDAPPALAPQSHEQHQAAGQHQDVKQGEKCCCEEMMHKMMQMMHEHQAKEAKLSEHKH